MSQKNDNLLKRKHKISDPLVKKFYEWADRRDVSKKNEPLVFITFLRGEESPLPAVVQEEFFSEPPGPGTWAEWNQYSATWSAIQDCCVKWSKSMTHQLQCCPNEIDYDYAAMQTLSSDILYAAPIIESQVFKKAEELEWNCCEWCWRIAINSNRCLIHADAASSATRKNQRLKRLTPHTSQLLNSIYYKLPMININEPLNLEKHLANLKLTTQYLINKGIDMSDNRAIIDALDDVCSSEERQKRSKLHEQLTKDYRSRILLAKCEFWHQIGVGQRKSGSGGFRPGAGRKPKSQK
jgi:hypothetical protein